MANAEASSFSSQLSELLALYGGLSPENEQLSLSLLRSLSCRTTTESAAFRRIAHDAGHDLPDQSPPDARPFERERPWSDVPEAAGQT
jgi:hypothetical protein